MFDGLLTTFRANRQRFRARRAQAVRIADAEPGELARIEGRIELDEAELVTPFARTRCVAFVSKMEEKVRRTVSGGWSDTEATYWVLQIHDEQRLAFWLVDDAGGRVRIRRDPAAMDLGFVDVSQVPTVNDENPEFVRYMRSKGIIPTLYFGIDGDHRFEEGCLVVGGRASVFGRFVEGKETVAAGYRDGAVVTRELAGTNDEPLVIRSA